MGQIQPVVRAGLELGISRFQVNDSHIEEVLSCIVLLSNHSPWLNFSAGLAHRQTGLFPTVGILNLLLISVICFIGPEKQLLGEVNLVSKDVCMLVCAFGYMDAV